MTAILLLALKLSVVALIFAIGLGSAPTDLTYLWRRPAQLARSLFAMYVAVPLAAVALVRVLPLPAGVKTAVLVLAISAGAPLLPRKLLKLGREGYVFSLVVTSSLLAVVAVPAWLKVLGPMFGREASVEAGAVALVIAKAFLAPLLLGMLLRWPLSRVADRASEWLLGAAGAVLALAGLALLALHGRLLVAAGWTPLLALAGMTGVALAIGHALGGPEPADRTALAVSCATRHVGIAMLAASTVPGPRVAAFVLAYVLASAGVSIPYLKWRRRAAAVDRGRAAWSVDRSLRSVLREPLVHFLLLGGLLFLYFGWRGGSGAGSNRIVIAPGLVEHLASGFARTWQRPPSDPELKGLIDDYVKEEIATREAVVMGLDRDDTIIRRRLRQKLEFLVEDASASSALTDADLHTWLEKHAESFRGEPQVAFRQVYLSPERRGAALRNNAEMLLGRLRASGPDVKTDRLGDATMLPADQPLAPLREATRSFGEDFAQELMKLKTGEWAGPVESPFGLHVVLVRERVEAAVPELSAIRPMIEREVLADRRKSDLDALYERLLQKYTVSIEEPKAEPAPSTAGGGAR